MVNIIHHNDADGYAAAYLIRKTYPEDMTNIRLFCMDYSIKFDVNDISDGDTVYIVDFSFDPDVMYSILKKTKDVTWIDHHRTAIDKYKGFKEQVKGVRFEGISGSGLTWLYLNEWTNKAIHELAEASVSHEEAVEVLEKYIKDGAPYWLRLVDDWDVWRHKYPESSFFNLAISNELSIDIFRRLDTSQENKELILLPVLVNKGKNYAQYRDSWSKRFMGEYGFVINLEGYKVFCVNGGSMNSIYYGDLIRKYDAVMNFCYNSFGSKKFKVSIYSEKIDVSKIAKKYGGGHPGASGFYFDDMNFIYDRMEEDSNE